MALYTFFLIPLLGAFLFFFFALITLLTIANAALGFVIFPGFPLEVDFLTAAIPAFTALLKVLTARFLVVAIAVAGETGAEVNAASYWAGCVITSCCALSNKILLCLPCSAAASNNCWPWGVCSAAPPSAAPAK